MNETPNLSAWWKWIPWTLVVTVVATAAAVFVWMSNRNIVLEGQLKAVTQDYQDVRDSVGRLLQKDSMQGENVNEAVDSFKQRYLRVITERDKLVADLASLQADQAQILSDKKRIDTENRSLLENLAQSEKKEEDLRRQLDNLSKENERLINDNTELRIRETVALAAAKPEPVKEPVVVQAPTKPAEAPVVTVKADAPSKPSAEQKRLEQELKTIRSLQSRLKALQAKDKEREATLKKLKNAGAELAKLDKRHEADLKTNRALENRLKQAKAQQKAADERIKSLEKEIKATKKTLSQKVKNEKQNVIQDSKKVLASLKNSNERMVALAADAQAAHYNLGLLYAKLGRYAEAVSEFERAIRLNKNDAYSHYNMAVIFDSHIPNPKAAIRHYEAYVRLLPQAQDAAKVQSRLYLLKTEGNITSYRNLTREFST